MEPPNSRLFLRATGTADVACLAAAIEAADVASLLIVPDAQGEHGRAEGMARDLLTHAQEHGVAVVVAEDVALARRIRADGVEVGDIAAYREARQALGRDAIVGVRCVARHAAMEAAEAGADYVAFPSDPDPASEDSLIAWWSPLFTVPCVAADPAKPEEAAILARAGADFVRPSDRMWESPEAAREICAATASAMAGEGA